MKKFLQSKIFEKGIIVAVSIFLLAGVTWAIDVSPSKFPAGTTNAVPYQNSSDQPSLFSSPLKWIFGKPRSEAMKRVQAPPHFKVDLLVEPKDYLATANTTLKAKMVAVNTGKDKYILEFPSAQHFEFVIQDSQGKEIYRWSKDKEFSQSFSSTLVNPKEKIAYEEEIFSSSNQVTRLPPGEYKMKGEITSKTPFTVESPFQVEGGKN